MHTSFAIRATRWAKRQVATLSKSCSSEGEIVATMTVRQLPPRLSRSTKVIIELRYGTCILPEVAFSCSHTSKDYWGHLLILIGWHRLAVLCS